MKLNISLLLLNAPLLFWWHLICLCVRKKLSKAGFHWWFLEKETVFCAQLCWRQWRLNCNHWLGGSLPYTKVKLWNWHCDIKLCLKVVESLNSLSFHPLKESTDSDWIIQFVNIKSWTRLWCPWSFLILVFGHLYGVWPYRMLGILEFMLLKPLQWIT